MCIEMLNNIDIINLEKVGGKAGNLIKLQKYDILVPTGWIITTDYFVRHLKKNNLFDLAIKIFANPDEDSWQLWRSDNEACC
jgi:phosphoenolpyruvate synthase/pyruvate phosphate dikinase